MRRIFASPERGRYGELPHQHTLELGEIEWLGKNGHRAQSRRALDDARGDVRGHQDDRRIACSAPKRREQLETGQAWHLDVRDDHVQAGFDRGFLARVVEELQQGAPIRRLYHLASRVTQQGTDPYQRVGVVVGEEHAHAPETVSRIRQIMSFGHTCRLARIDHGHRDLLVLVARLC